MAAYLVTDTDDTIANAEYIFWEWSRVELLENKLSTYKFFTEAIAATFNLFFLLIFKTKQFQNENTYSKLFGQI